MLVRIYLSGSIRKGDRDARSPIHFWSGEDEDAIRRGVVGAQVQLLNPAKAAIRRSDYDLNFSHDLYLVATSHIVLVDGRTAKGIGVGVEMMLAAERSLPVITWAPRNSHYRRDYLPNVFGEDLHNWVHPFIHGLSDYIVETLEDAVALVNRYVSNGYLELRKDPNRAIARFAEHHADECAGN